MANDTDAAVAEVLSNINVSGLLATPAAQRLRIAETAEIRAQAERIIIAQCMFLLEATVQVASMMVEPEVSTCFLST